MSKRQWHDLIWWLEELAEMRRDDDVWVVPLNPNYTIEEQMLIAYYIERFDEMNEKEV